MNAYHRWGTGEGAKAPVSSHDELMLPRVSVHRPDLFKDYNPSKFRDHLHMPFDRLRYKLKALNYPKKNQREIVLINFKRYIHTPT
jgi:hypothetical protein